MANPLFKIRKAVLADAKGIARIHVGSWKTTYTNIVPDEYLKSLTYERREQLWLNSIPNGGVYVAEYHNGEIIGFLSGGFERSGKYSGFYGELYAIYILKEHQGKGIGKALVKTIAEEFRGMGINSMLVLVLKDNPSCEFYKSLGAKHMDTVEVEIGGKKLSEVVYGWEEFGQLVN